MSAANKSGNDHAADADSGTCTRALEAHGFTRPFRVALVSGVMVQLACMVMPEGPVEAVVRAAAAAEDLGCGRVWIPDEGLAARECWVTLGAVADGFIMSFVHKELIGEHVAAIRSTADEFGRSHPRLCYMTILATTEAARQAARASLTFRLVDSPETVKARIGLDPATEAAIRRGLADGGPAAAAHLVRDDWVDAFVISGTVQECRAELNALVTAHGIDEFQVSVNDLHSAFDDLSLAAEIVGGPR